MIPVPTAEGIPLFALEALSIALNAIATAPRGRLVSTGGLMNAASAFAKMDTKEATAQR